MDLTVAVVPTVSAPLAVDRTVSVKAPVAASVPAMDRLAVNVETPVNVDPNASAGQPASAQAVDRAVSVETPVNVDPNANVR